MWVAAAPSCTTPSQPTHLPPGFVPLQQQAARDIAGCCQHTLMQWGVHCIPTGRHESSRAPRLVLAPRGAPLSPPAAGAVACRPSLAPSARAAIAWGGWESLATRVSNRRTNERMRPAVPGRCVAGCRLLWGPHLTRAAQPGTRKRAASQVAAPAAPHCGGQKLAPTRLQRAAVNGRPACCAYPGCRSHHSRMLERSALLGVRCGWASGRLVIGLVVWCWTQPAMASRS